MDSYDSAVGSFDELIATRLHAETTAVASRWLTRLNALLPVEVGAIFPGERLLDHIPALVAEIANYVVAPQAEEIASNTAILDKARELGLLRYEQQASLHQLLREYELLAEILASFVAETAMLVVNAAPVEVLRVARRVDRAVRALMRVTVETFVGAYAARLAEQQQKLESFRHTVSHEMRNPIGALLVASRIARQSGSGSDSERAHRALDVIDRSAQRLSALIQHLQRFTGDQLAENNPNEQITTVSALAEDVARQLREAAEARGVIIRVLDGLPTVLTDPARLELVLVNLLSNGIKYADPDKPDREVTVTGAPSEDGWWGFCVQDNGLGIADDLLPHIFERFMRAHADLDAALGVDGSGLGLSIAKESVTALGGTISCRSAVGVGSTFTVLFPGTSAATSAS